MNPLRAVALTLAAWLLVAAGPLVRGFDVPMPDGFEEVRDARMEFDTPGGRVIETALAGRQDPAEVMVFLAGSADALGWAPLGPAADGDPQRYVRGRERLSIKVERQRQWTVIRLLIEPIQ